MLLIASVTAYNDFVLFNTYVIGSALPLGLLLFFLVFVMLINGPLWKWRPGAALSRGELAVALGMMLVSCAIPASGFMRYLPAQLVAPYSQSAGRADVRAMLDEANLADWVYPTLEGKTARERAADPVVTNFWNRDPRPRLSWLDNWRAVPWRAWLRPAVAWGALLVALYGMIFCAAVIVRRQWVENERLPFPLATIYTSLIESPAPGRALNSLFTSRAFWAASVIVFVVHGVNALNSYFPKTWPRIPLGYNLGTLMTDPPLSYTDWALPVSVAYFSVIGITFFVQSKIAFSLWFFYAIFYQLERIAITSMYGEFHDGMKTDQLFGGLVVYALTILWIGRGQWRLVARQMLHRAAPAEPTGKYLPYRAAGWGFVGCALAILVWLVAAGASAIGAVVIVLMMMMVMLVTARAIAETGLVFVQFDVPLFQPWVYALQSMPQALKARTTMGSFYLSALMGTAFTRDVREPMPAYATHALKVADDNAFSGDQRNWRRAAPFVVVMVLALVLTYVVSGTSLLYVEYNYGATLDRDQLAPINDWAMFTGAKRWTIDPPTEYRPPGIGPREGHNRLASVGFGAGLTALLGYLRLRFLSWPLHPIGFLLAYSFPLQVLWFSIFIGWLVKAVLLRFGGGGVMRRARPLFIGLILGEAFAAAFWLVVNLVLNALGMTYHKVVLFPS